MKKFKLSSLPNIKFPRFQNINIPLSDRIALIALGINTVVVVGLGIWNINLENRLARIEMDEFAPRLVVDTKIDVVQDHDSINYRWSIRNVGRKIAEDVIITVFTSREFPIYYCVARDSTVEEPVPVEQGDSTSHPDLPFISWTYSGLQIYPHDYALINCYAKHGTRSSFLAEYGIYPEEFKVGYACYGYDEEHPSYKLPYIFIRGKNIEGPKVDFCGE